MDSESSLSNLPVEVLDAIVVYLAVEDICRLRLTSRGTADQVARTTFKTCFNTKNVTLSHEDLAAFAVITEQPWISSSLRQLTIVGLADFSHDREDSLITDDGEILGLLTSALTNIKRHSSHGRLCSLSIHIEYTSMPIGFRLDPLNPTGLQADQRCAIETARVLARALKASRLLADRLDLYGDTFQCALGPGEMALFKDCMAIETCTSLSLAISAGYEDVAVREISAQFPGQIVQTLIATTSLEHLHLRWYKVRSPSLLEEERRGHNLFDSITRISGNLSHLKRVSLGGIYTTETSLLSFLIAHSKLDSLVLEEIHLLEGRFLPIFSYIDERMSLESLYLNDLWERRLIQFLSASGRPYFPCSGAPTWMKRLSSDRRRPIRYQQTKGRLKGSAAAAKWRRQKHLKYGLP